MPLQRGSSKRARQANIETEIAAGKPPKQAVAIAYSVQRRAKRPAYLDEIPKHLTKKGKLRDGR
jgi:hypothetical protein